MAKTWDYVAKADVVRALDLHCKRVDGLAIYEDGWSDKCIADTLGIERQWVTNMRVKIVGKLPNAPGTAGGDPFEQINALRARIERLEQKII